jgi:uncharacterized membrane protein
VAKGEREREMGADGMSQTQVRAWSATVIWTLVGAGFVAVFFGWGGPAAFSADRIRVVAGAVAIGAGYAAYSAVLLATRARHGEVVADERDAEIGKRATLVTIVVVLVAVYGLSIGLWEAYRSEGAVPVGWLWFLAYGAVIVTFVVHAVATLVLDARQGIRGDR